jgi:hypothetical protein
LDISGDKMRDATAVEDGDPLLTIAVATLDFMNRTGIRTLLRKDDELAGRLSAQ